MANIRILRGDYLFTGKLGDANVVKDIIGPIVSCECPWWRVMAGRHAKPCNARLGTIIVTGPGGR